MSKQTEGTHVITIGAATMECRRTVKILSASAYLSTQMSTSLDRKMGYEDVAIQRTADVDCGHANTGPHGIAARSEIRGQASQNGAHEKSFE